MSDKLDQEFKMFVKFRGFNIDSSMFSIKFNAPQNFASYRQAELDQPNLGVLHLGRTARGMRSLKASQAREE